MVEAFIKGITLGLLLSIAVGPVLFSILKQSLNNGHKGGLAFAFGVSASDILLVVLSNIFSEFFGTISTHRTVIGIAGSALLIIIGVYFLFFKKVKTNEQGEHIIALLKKKDLFRISLSGFFMNTLNPAIMLFWLTTSSTFISHSNQQRAIIFITCLAFALSADILKVFLAGKIRNRLTPHNIHIINRINGIILIVFGAVLIWSLVFYGDRFG